MGEIADREKEHLGTSDLGIIAMWRRLLAAVKAHRDRAEIPAEITNPACYAVRADAILLPAVQHSFDATVERRAVAARYEPRLPPNSQIRKGGKLSRRFLFMILGPLA